ncbi:hypothetical protein LTR85_005369 [Meristemomyces frigidus]|nr:hypothetical protein LTR85_005369 [Meristemomyces frigidus]
MDGDQDIPDSTDWLKTPLKDFAQLENALHCQICKEFYDTPMITSCSHTFCSKCIRTSLSADGKCPACRTADQASKLRNNWALQEVVATFRSARPAAISIARREQEEVAQARRPGKRKRAIMDSDEVEGAAAEGRTTRSKSRRVAASQTDPIEIGDTDGDDDFEPEQPDDGLVECPLGCGKRMQIEQVEPHLDRCEDEKKQERRAKSRTPVNGLSSSRPASAQPTRPQDRISELNYSLLRDNAMRKKLEEIGIPGWGSKQLMVKRHTEWVNLWNANCDSNHPRTKRELLHDLDTWERTQGGRAPNTQSGLANGVMRKDFDGTGWASKNKDEFSRLIADARRKKSNPATASNPPKEEDAPEDASKPALDGDEDSSPHFNSASSPQPAPPQLPTEDSSQPYADNPDAIASIREKVEAANAGRHIEPVMNAGFRSPEAQSESSAPSRAPGGDGAMAPPASLSHKPSDPAPESQNPALLEHSHFGHDAEPRSQTSSTNGHTVQHHAGSPLRKIPMFDVPQSPVTDFENDGGTGVH